MRPLLASLLFLLGCGGTAIVDDLESEGDATTGGSGFGLCATPDPVGVVEVCAATAVTTPDGEAGCELTSCDEGDQRWVAACSGPACECLFEGLVQCSCRLDDGSDICGGDITSCCPAPWPR